MMYYYPKTTAGFSIVEMLVAVSLLLLVIIGPMTITTRTAKSTTYATEQVTAFFLAQEGIELAQKIRDDLLLQHFNGTLGVDPWARFTDRSNTGPYRFCYSSYSSGNGCGLEWSETNQLVLDTIRDCNTAGNCLLERDISTTNARSTFTYDTTVSEPTLYTRRIIFTAVPDVNPTSVRVNSIVTWRTGSLVASQQVEVETYLYDVY